MYILLTISSIQGCFDCFQSCYVLPLFIDYHQITLSGRFYWIKLWVLSPFFKNIHFWLLCVWPLTSIVWETTDPLGVTCSVKPLVWEGTSGSPKVIIYSEWGLDSGICKLLWLPRVRMISWWVGAGQASAKEGLSFKGEGHLEKSILGQRKALAMVRQEHRILRWEMTKRWD